MDKIFTKDELAQYDGKTKPQKYVAIDGVIYDLTPMAAWSGDNHHGHVAGHDLSAEIVNAPHKKTVLKKLKVVGKLAE